MYRLAFNCLHNQTPQRGPLSAEELHNMRMKLIADCQREAYWQEIHTKAFLYQAKSKHLVLIQQLHLFLDSEGFIHCGGKIYNAPLSHLTNFHICSQQNICSPHLLTMLFIPNCGTLESAVQLLLLNKAAGCPLQGSI